MKINEFFQKAFYINLDSRPDRKIQMEEELLKYGLDTFFNRSSAFIPKIDDLLNKPDELGARKHGGCGRSHVNLVKYAKEEGMKNILIFEDDATFYNGGKELGITLVEKALNTLSSIEDWDITYLGGIIFDEKVKVISENLVKVDKILTTHAWGLSSRVYDSILKYKPNDGYSTHFDSPIDGLIGNNVRLNKYLVYPLAVYQRPGIVSDCAQSGLGEPYKSTDVEPWLRNYEKELILK